MILPRRFFAIFSLLLIVFSIIPAIPISQVEAAGPSAPGALSVKVAPSTLPADGGTYPAVFVSLLDATGSPTLALANVTVFLTSSIPAVGTVLNSSMVIRAGRGYVAASFKTTPTTGSTDITATATGLTSGTTKLTTGVLRGYPTSISLSAVPSQVNSATTSLRSGTLIVALQDQAGLPAKAAADTIVSVYSSSPKILTLNSTSFTLKAGQLVKVLSFATGFVPGSAVVTAFAPQLNSGAAQVTVLGTQPLALQLYAQPSSLVTSGTGRLVIALTDLNGKPTRAQVNTQVQISSSSTSTVSVLGSSFATISAGSTYTTITLSAGSFPGSATLTVSSSGLKSGFVTILTYVPRGAPTGLKLFVGPNPVLADHGNYSAVVVSLLNSNGLPTVSNSTSYTVSLTSSQNSSVGNFGRSAFTTASIPSGTNNVVWTTLFTSTFVAGSTLLTVSATNLLPDTGALGTFGPVPSKISISSLFPTVPADGIPHHALQVSLADSFGAPAVAPTPVTIYLASSKTGIAQVGSTVTIAQGKSAVVVDVTTTSVSGIANVTAYTTSLSSGYASATVLVQTATPSPSAVGAYLSPAILAPSPSQTSSLLLLQVQDSVGNPAKARQITNLTVTSSNTAVFNRTLLVQIPQGGDYVAVPIVPLAPGSTTFTIVSPGLSTATAQFQALNSPIAAGLTASSLSIFTNGTATITFGTTIDGQGVGGVGVTWSSSGGSLTQTTSKTNAQGQAAVTFTPTSVGVANITAVVSSPLVGNRHLSSQIIVSQAPKSSAKGLLNLLLSFPYILIIVGAATAMLILAFLLVRRRRRSAQAEGAIGEEEAGFSYLIPDAHLGLGVN